MLRLSIVYALLDGCPEIDTDHVRAAKAVWDYCEASAAYVFGHTLGDPVADRLLEAIKAGADQGLTGEQMSAVFGRHVSASRLELAREELLSRGVITVETKQTRGRPLLLARYCEISEESEESR
jgi:hypothetical protein